MDTASVIVGTDVEGWQEARGWAGAFLAGYASAQTRRNYRRDLDCWFAFCAAHQLHPCQGLRRTHLEVYLRSLEAQPCPPSAGTLYRRISTLSSWFRWLEDEDVIVGNPAARVRRPHRYPRPQPWLNRNELTDLLAAGEDEGGDAYALVCLLGLNGLRVSEACNANVTDLAGSRYRQRCASSARATSPRRWSSIRAPSRRSTRPSTVAVPARCCATSGAGGCSRTTPPRSCADWRSQPA